VVFSEEEVHIVELNGVRAVLCDQVTENRSGTLGRFHALLIAVRRMNATEAAVEGASDAGVVHRSAFAEEGWPQIFFDWEAMKGMPRKLVWSLHGPLGVVAGKAEDVFV
jgi:hypothetical protein